MNLVLHLKKFRITEVVVIHKSKTEKQLLNGWNENKSSISYNIYLFPVYVCVNVYTWYTCVYVHGVHVCVWCTCVHVLHMCVCVMCMYACV